MVTTSTSGTAHNAGYCKTVAANPAWVNRCPASSAPSETSPPVIFPAMAPGTVNPRHQIANTTTGASDEAVKVKTMATAPASASPVVKNVAMMGITMAKMTPIRNPRTEPPKNSWETTPEMETTNPETVDKKAANAPPATRAVSRSPETPENSAPGNCNNAVSVLVPPANSGRTARATTPRIIGRV